MQSATEHIIQTNFYQSSKN